MADQKLKRAARRRRRITIAVSILALIVAAVAAYIIVMSIRNARQTREILIQQEKFYAKQASQLLDEGDTYTALLLLNELTDPTGPFAKIPLQPEAECQMRRAVQMHDEAEWQVEWSIRNVGNIAYTPQMTPDGKYLVASIPGEINIFNILNGEFVSQIKFSGIKKPVFSISHDGGKIAVFVKHHYNDSILLYNLPSGDFIKSLYSESHKIWGEEYPMFFSHDDSHIIYASCKVVGEGDQRGWTLDCLSGLDIDSCKHFIRYGEGPIAMEIPKKQGGIITSTKWGKNHDSKTVIVAEECTGKIITEIDFPDCLSYKRDREDNRYLNYACLNDNELLLQKKDGIYMYTIDEKKWQLMVSGTFDMSKCADMKFGISQNLFMATNLDSVYLFRLNDGSLFSKFRIDPTHFDYASLNYDDNVILVNKRDGNIIILKHTITSSAKQELIDDTLDIQNAEFVGQDSALVGFNYDNNTTRCWSHSIDGNMLSDDSIGNVDYCFIGGSSMSQNGRYIIYYDLMGIMGDRRCHIYDRWERKREIALKTNLFSGFFLDDDVSFYYLKSDNSDTLNKCTMLRKFNIKTGDTVDCARIPRSCVFKDWNTKKKCLLIVYYPGDYVATFNLETNKIIAEKKIYYIGQSSIDNTTMKYTPDGRYLIITRNDRTICLYDPMTLEVLDSCKRGLSYVLGFSPDSKYVLLDVDNRMEMWSLTPFKPVWIIENDTFSELKREDENRLPSLTFSKDGKSIIFYSEKMYKDGRLHFTRIPVLSQEELKARVQELAAGRKLTEEEKNLLME